MKIKIVPYEEPEVLGFLSLTRDFLKEHNLPVESFAVQLKPLGKKLPVINGKEAKPYDYILCEARKRIKKGDYVILKLNRYSWELRQLVHQDGVHALIAPNLRPMYLAKKETIEIIGVAIDVLPSLRTEDNDKKK